MGSAKRFTAKLRRPIEAGDREAQRQLARLIAPFVLRRTKAAALQELPSRTEVDLLVEPSPQEAALLEVLRRRALTALEEADRANPVKVLAQLTRLRLAACSPRLVEGGELIEGVGSKLEAFGELAAGGGAATRATWSFTGTSPVSSVGSPYTKASWSSEPQLIMPLTALSWAPMGTGGGWRELTEG